MPQRRVHRRGGSLRELLAQRLFVKDSDGACVPVFREPVALTAGKSTWPIFAAQRELFRSAREEGHQGLRRLSRPRIMVTQHGRLFLGTRLEVKSLNDARDVYFASKPAEVLGQVIDERNQVAHSGRVVVQF